MLICSLCELFLKANHGLGFTTVLSSGLKYSLTEFSDRISHREKFADKKSESISNTFVLQLCDASDEKLIKK